MPEITFADFLKTNICVGTIELDTAAMGMGDGKLG